MFVSNLASTTTLDGSALKIGIVQARFNDDITNALAAACIAELKAMGVSDDRITHVHVPGALEVPLALAALAQIEDPEPFSALIALGCIIRGETYHFELVANESGAGVSRVGLDAELPIAIRVTGRFHDVGAFTADVANLSRIVVWWRDVDWRAVGAYSATGVPFAALGAWTGSGSGFSGASRTSPREPRARTCLQKSGESPRLRRPKSYGCKCASFGPRASRPRT